MWCGLSKGNGGLFVASEERFEEALQGERSESSRCSCKKRNAILHLEKQTTSRAAVMGVSIFRKTNEYLINEFQTFSGWMMMERFKRRNSTNPSKYKY